MVDAHCHLYDTAYSEFEIEEVITRARMVGVKAMVCNGAGIATSLKAIGLAEKYPEVYATVGIHPEEQAEIESMSFEEVEQRLFELTAKPKVVAIGEAGLDFTESTTEEEKLWQIELFKINLNLANRTKLPIVIHNRNADHQIKELLSSFDGQMQLHCFTGNRQMLDWAVNRGIYISIGGIVTFKNGKNVYDLVKDIPNNLLLTETDSPYLSPEPNRGKRNEPKNVKIIVEQVAKARNSEVEKITFETHRNAKDLFNLETE